MRVLSGLLLLAAACDLSSEGGGPSSHGRATADSPPPSARTLDPLPAPADIRLRPVGLESPPSRDWAIARGEIAGPLEVLAKQILDEDGWRVVLIESERPNGTLEAFPLDSASTLAAQEASARLRALIRVGPIGAPTTFSHETRGGDRNSPPFEELWVWWEGDQVADVSFLISTNRRQMPNKARVAAAPQRDAQLLVRRLIRPRKAESPEVTTLFLISPPPGRQIEAIPRPIPGLTD